MSRAARGTLLHTDLRYVIYALSDALDLVGISDIAHGKRVGIMAAECAQTAGWSRREVAFMFDLGLLHDVGVSSTVTHGNLVAEFDWEEAQEHCEVGYRLLRDFAPLARLALPLRYHHTHWDRLLAEPVDADVALHANLIFLTDRVDALAAPYLANGTLLMHASDIRARIAALAGRCFAPPLVEHFLAASASEAFWLRLEARGIQAYLNDMLGQGEPYRAQLDELKHLATILSRIVDAKSRFTAEHSLGVARLARFLAERLGVSAEHCEEIEIAGLLHDIGKLRVPDQILDKPGRLDDGERSVMNTHSFETYQILRQVPGFERIAPWAAYHHEEPGGRGYPFHLAAETLPLEARILRVADIFQAMAQDRPYRPGLPAVAVQQYLEELVQAGRLDADIVAVAGADLHGAMAAAHPSVERWVAA